MPANPTGPGEGFTLPEHEAFILSRFEGEDEDAAAFAENPGISLELANGAVIDHDESKFGVSSVVFPAAGTVVFAGHPPKLDGDQTYEFFCRLSASEILTLSCDLASRFDIRVHQGAGVEINSLRDVNDDPFITEQMYAGTVPAGQWLHIALVRRGRAIAIYIEGERIALEAMNMLGSFELGEELTFVTDQTDNVWVDAVRFARGARYWGASFTPPVRPFMLEPGQRRRYSEAVTLQALAFTSPTTASIDENTGGPGDSFYTAGVNQPTGVTFSISGGPDAALFEINATTGELNFLAAPDFEDPQDADTNNVYLFTLQATDGVQVATLDVEITVNDVAVAFTSSATVSLDENTGGPGDPFYTATADQSPVTFAISGGDDAALFDIDPDTGELTFLAAPDFEDPQDADTDNEYLVTLEVTYGTEVGTLNLAVTVDDVAEGGLTLSLQHFEGTDGVTVTVLTDEVGGVTWTPDDIRYESAAGFFKFGTTGIEPMPTVGSGADATGFTLDPSSPWTYEVFLKGSTSGKNAVGGTVLLYDTNLGQICVTFGFVPAPINTYTFQVRDSGGSLIVNDSGATTQDNTIKHVAIVYDGSSYQAYIEGVRIVNAAVATNMRTPTHLRLSLPDPSIGDGAAFDEERLSQTARYTGATLTVPTSAFVVD